MDLNPLATGELYGSGDPALEAGKTASFVTPQLCDIAES